MDSNAIVKIAKQCIINDENSFRSHLRFHFGRKTDVYQESYTCPFVNCRTPIKDKNYVRMHLIQFHQNEVPFLLRGQKIMKKFKSDSIYIYNEDNENSDLIKNHNLSNVSNEVTIDSNLEEAQDLNNELIRNEIDNQCIDSNNLCDLNEIEPEQDNFFNLCDPPVYVDLWSKFVQNQEDRSIIKLMRQAKSETGCSEYAIVKCFGIASNYFQSKLDDGGVTQNTLDQFRKFKKSFYYANKNSIAPNNEPVLKEYEIKPKIPITILKYYYISIISLLQTLASDPDFMKAIF